MESTDVKILTLEGQFYMKLTRCLNPGETITVKIFKTLILEKHFYVSTS